MTASGLSQQVVCNQTPYDIEIFKTETAQVWQVDAIDSVSQETVWTGTAPDDATAFLNAMRQIHALAHAA